MSTQVLLKRAVISLASVVAAWFGWSAQGATLDRSQSPIGTLQAIAAFKGPGPSGIAVTPFMGFPRHAIDHAGMTLGEMTDGRWLALVLLAAHQSPPVESAHRGIVELQTQ